MLFPTTQLVADTVLPTLESLEPSMGRHKMGTKAKGTRNHAKIILSFQKGLGRGVDHIGVITQPCAIPSGVFMLDPLLPCALLPHNSYCYTTGGRLTPAILRLIWFAFFQPLEGSLLLWMERIQYLRVGAIRIQSSKNPFSQTPVLTCRVL